MKKGITGTAAAALLCAAIFGATQAQAFCDPAVSSCLSASDKTCDQLGRTTMDGDQQNIVACLASPAGNNCSAGQCAWKSMSGSGTLQMRSPVVLFSTNSGFAWAPFALPGVPSGSKYVVLHYTFGISGPDNIGATYVKARANSAGEVYTLVAAQASGESDAVAGSGQAFIPFDTTTNTVDLTLTHWFNGGVTVSVVGYM